MVGSRRAMGLILMFAVSSAVAQTMPAGNPEPTSTAKQRHLLPGVMQKNPGDVAIRFIDEPSRRVLQLNNGLTVILESNTTAPVVACRVYVKAGSLTEAEYMGTGISHVLEHLVAGASSKKVKEAQSKQILQKLGNDSNAYTTFDHTCYFITTSKDKWADAMDLLANWVTGAAFTQAQFDREYQVVQREIEMGEAEAGRTFGKLIEANRYLVHPAGHPVIGYKTAFQKLTMEDCQKYYDRMYVPDNEVVSIAGDINLEEAEKVVRTAFGGVERKKVPAISLPAEPPVTAPRTAVARADVRRAKVDWAFPTVTVYSPDLYALDALAGVLAQGDSSPLVRLMRDEKQLVLSLSADDSTPKYADGALEFYAEVEPEKIPEAQRVLLEELEKVKANGIDPAQLEKTKNQMAASLIYGNQTAEQKAVRNAQDYLTNGNIDGSKLYVERIKQVTPEQVQAAARKYIDSSRLLTTVLLPLDAPDLVLKHNMSDQVAVEKSPVQKFSLSNGLTVLVAHNTSSPLVSFRYDTLGGLLAENDSNNGVGNALTRLLERGTEKMSYQEEAEFLDRTSSSLASGSTSNAFSVSAQSLKEHADKMFDLFRDTILHPALSQHELDIIRPQLLAAIDKETEDWFAEGLKFLRASYYKDSPYQYLTPGSKDVVSKLNAADIRAHYDKYLLNPEHAVLTIVGDVDLDQAKAWAKQFESMPKGGGALATGGTRAPAGTLIQEVKKSSAAIMVGYGPGLTVNSPDRFAMQVLQTMLGGYASPSGSWLHETLRGQGLVYVVQASSAPGKLPGMFLVTALGEADKADDIVAGINQQVEKGKKGDFTDAELARAKEQIITGESLRNQTISAVASDAAINELYGMGYDASTHYSENIAKVTREDVIRVANQYLKDPLVTIDKPAAK